MKNTIRDYILGNLLFTEDPSVLQDDDSFLTQGIIDSTGVLEIILFIEETFGIKVNDDEMLPTNLDSVNNLVDFVRSKQAVAA
ncbi:MAG: acyl carrier protein [Methylobacter sp.]|nr:acyl carrier protein [Methylobacter sp.]MDP2097460.1 acyl carrier protein [Methylobacter sp.]MDP2427234.1 acyl carrier protein [Methylobacter sp.]MDP3053976.1 acyl carrier protein [Methylobacter sp.]MDP3361582.1 acyl carrier protein [Methylobacter sp.]